MSTVCGQSSFRAQQFAEPNSPGHTRLSTWRLRLFACLAVVMFVSLAHTVLVRATESTPVRLGVPSYFRSDASWTALLSEPSAVGLVLINPASGPGMAVDATYAAITTRVRNSGVQALGYVPTTYGTRPIADVMADMTRYRNFYGISSFFFDETPNVCSIAVGATVQNHVSYYGQLFAAVHGNAGEIAVLNPGTNVPECFLAVSDVIVNFEASAAAYATWAPDPWVNNAPANHFWHLIYDVDSDQRDSIAKSAGARHAGYVYATDDILPNPWDGLGTSASFQAMRDALRPGGRTAAPVVSSISTVPVRSAAPQAGPTTTLKPAARSPLGSSETPDVLAPEITSTTLVAGSSYTPSASVEPIPATFPRPTIPVAPAVTIGPAESAAKLGQTPDNNAATTEPPSQDYDLSTLETAPLSVAEPYGQSDDALLWLRFVEFGDVAFRSH